MIKLSLGGVYKMTSEELSRFRVPTLIRFAVVMLVVWLESYE